MSSFSLEVEASIATVRREVADLHAELTRNGLVVWTGGNVSGRVPGADLFVIKPMDARPRSLRSGIRAYGYRSVLRSQATCWSH